MSSSRKPPPSIAHYGAARRYTGKAATYRSTRPSYPPEVVARIAAAGALGSDAVVADVGAGTGAFTLLLREAGFIVRAVEPNEEMRAVAQERVPESPRVRWIAGSAEATTLADRSVDAIVSAQAFHWFDGPRTVAEFRRILKPGGVIGLVWNEYKPSAGAFQESYLAALRAHCPDIGAFDLEALGHSVSRLGTVFGGARVVEARFDNVQTLDREGARGRAASVSYCPPVGSEPYTSLMAAVDAGFTRHARDGAVTLQYDVFLYCIWLDAPDAP